MGVVSLGAALLAVVAAASSPARSAVEPNRSVQSDVVSVVITLVCVAAALILAVLLKVLASHRGGSSSEAVTKRGSELARALGLLLAFGVLALIVFLLLRGGHSHKSLHFLLSGPPAVRKVGVPGKPVAFNSTASGLTIVVLAVIAFLVFGRGQLAWLLRRRRERAGFSQFVPTPTAPEPVRADAATAERPAAAELGDPVGEPDPRLSVVLAYQRFVAVMARAGEARRETETPYEFSRRVLAARGRLVSPEGREVTSDLTTLFNTARYSAEPLSGDERLRAIDDLAIITAHLRTSP